MPSLRFALALVAAAAAGPLLRADSAGDEAALRRLNGSYLRAFLGSDTGTFRSLLADDFSAVLADGSVIGRAEFFRQAALPPALRDFAVVDVDVRLHGDAAVVYDLASYRHPDGSPGRTRYTLFWVRQADGWRVASLQIVRVAPSVR